MKNSEKGQGLVEYSLVLVILAILAMIAEWWADFFSLWF